MKQLNDKINNPLHNPMWLLLSAISIPRESGHQIEQVLDKFLLVLKELGLSQETHLRIKGSIMDAARNAEMSKDNVGLALPLLIQILIEKNNGEWIDPEADKKIGEIEQRQIGLRSNPGQTRKGSQDPKRPIHQGWGYFVVEKAVERPSLSTDTPHYLIRVFLYKEGNED